MKKHLFFLPAILILILAASCSVKELDKEDTPISVPGKGNGLSFIVELESDYLGTRNLGEPGFGNGNQVNNLMYALYTQDSSADDSDDEGDLNPVLLWDEREEKYVPLMRVPFRPAETNTINIEGIEIVKGIEYTLMLWAQYRPDNENDADDKIYFELRNDGIIRILSHENFQFPNNDDQRDVFCAVYKIVQYEDSRQLKLTLRRPFAQINIAAPFDVLKRRQYIDENNNLLIDESAITISGDIANRYNLFKNRAEKANNVSFTRSFKLNVIPAKSPENGYDENNGELRMLRVKDRDSWEETELVWLSMCYILPDGKLGDVSYINIDDFTFTYKEGDEEVTKSLDKEEGRPLFTGIPALRNRRTNIILKASDFGAWKDLPHSDITDDNMFNDLIEYFLSVPANYNDNDQATQESVKQLTETYGDYILEDDDRYKCIMLKGTFNLTPVNGYLYILPVHRDFILYGDGETIIIKNANSMNNRQYHNIGQVRNIHIMDKNEKNHIFIDEDGYVSIYDENNNEIKTDKKLEPLNGNNRSYNVYCDDGTVNPDPYFH